MTSAPAMRRSIVCDVQNLPFILLVIAVVLPGTASADRALQTAASQVQIGTAAGKTKGAGKAAAAGRKEASHNTLFVSQALATAAKSASAKDLTALGDHTRMAARFNEVHNKAKAHARLGVKAHTFATENLQRVHDSMEWLPFVLPPVGLTLLAFITLAVVSIRKWQKIPSMPTQGRMDIKDVLASAKQAGPERTSMEMSRSWDNL